MRDTGGCPHCKGPTWAEHDGYQQIQPAVCESCGAHEFWPGDGLEATDEELWSGWWMGDAGTQIILSPACQKVVKHRRIALKREADEASAVTRAQQERIDARQRYVDEALF